MIQRPSLLVAILYQYYTVLRYGVGGQAPNMPNMPGMPNLADMQNIPNMQDIPQIYKDMYKKEIEKQYKGYNPSAGYEPYWPQGTWVFEDEDLKKYGTTTKVPLVCGEECNYLFRGIKKLCAKRLKVVAIDGCSPGLFKTCDGYYPDALTGFFTFDTYCEFLDTQCRTTAASRWIFVHLGRCINQNDVFKPVQHHSNIFSRMKSYLSTLEDVFRNASLPSPQGLTSTAGPENP